MRWGWDEADEASCEREHGGLFVDCLLYREVHGRIWEGEIKPQIRASGNFHNPTRRQQGVPEPKVPRSHVENQTRGPIFPYNPRSPAQPFPSSTKRPHNTTASTPAAPATAAAAPQTAFPAGAALTALAPALAALPVALVALLVALAAAIPRSLLRIVASASTTLVI